jgi:hypothetical protein
MARLFPKLSPTVTLGLLLASTSTLAAQSPPDGLRVFVTGHSFHVFVAPMLAELADAAGIERHVDVGRQGIGGSTVLRHWERPDSVNTAKPALRSGDVDVFTMSPIVVAPDAGITRFAELGLEHNPDLRLVIQASWIPGDQTLPVDEPERDRWLTDNALRDARPVEELRPALDDVRFRLERQVDELNARFGREAVVIVPVGYAILRLRELVREGSFPGVEKESDLFTDAVGHGHGHINALTAYSNFVALYGLSPVGLDLPLDDVTPAQHAILQKLAWEVVSNYAYSGIRRADEENLRAAVTPLPTDLRAGAGVRVELSGGGFEDLRTSTNGLTCALLQPSDLSEPFLDARCYSDLFWPAVLHRWALDPDPESFAEAHSRMHGAIEAGIVSVPDVPTAGYRVLGPMAEYDVQTGHLGPTIQKWQSIHFPFRTSPELGLTEVEGDMTRDDLPGLMPFVMASGTWWSHVMIMHEPWPWN